MFVYVTLEVLVRAGLEMSWKSLQLLESIRWTLAARHRGSRLKSNCRCRWARLELQLNAHSGACKW